MSLGILFAILGSAAFGFNSASVRRGVTMAAATQGLYLTVFFGLILFALAALVSGQIFDAGRVTLTDYLILAAGGVVHIMIGRYCNYRAVGAMGANRANPIVGMSTLVSVLIAVAFLSEEMTPLKAVGIVLVMAGPSLVARRRAKRPAPAPAGASGDGPKVSTSARDNPRMLEGYFWGAMAASFWGLGPVLMRAGVDASGLSMMGGLVTYGAAGTVLLLSLAIPGQFAGAVNLDNRARMWFLLAGFNSFLANVFRFSALALAPVSVVIPMMRTSVVFGLGFNLLMNRSLETFEPRVLGGIAISAAGATLLVI